MHSEPEPGETGHRDDHPRPDPPGPSRPATGDGPDRDEADDRGNHRAKRMPGGETEPGSVRHRIGERRPGPPDQLLEPRGQQPPTTDRHQGEQCQQAGGGRIGSADAPAAGTPPQLGGTDHRDRSQDRRVEDRAHPPQRGHQPSRGGRQPAQRRRDVGVVVQHRRPGSVDHDREHHEPQDRGLRAPAKSTGTRWHRRVPAHFARLIPACARPRNRTSQMFVRRHGRATAFRIAGPCGPPQLMSFWSNLPDRSGRPRPATEGPVPPAAGRRAVPLARASDSPGRMARLARSEGRPLDIAEGKPGSEDPARGARP